MRKKSIALMFVVLVFSSGFTPAFAGQIKAKKMTRTEVRKIKLCESANRRDLALVRSGEANTGTTVLAAIGVIAILGAVVASNKKKN